MDAARFLLESIEFLGGGHRAALETSRELLRSLTVGGVRFEPSVALSLGTEWPGPEWAFHPIPDGTREGFPGAWRVLGYPVDRLARLLNIIPRSTTVASFEWSSAGPLPKATIYFEALDQSTTPFERRKMLERCMKEVLGGCPPTYPVRDELNYIAVEFEGRDDPGSVKYYHQWPRGIPDEEVASLSEHGGGDDDAIRRWLQTVRSPSASRYLTYFKWGAGGCCIGTKIYRCYDYRGRPAGVHRLNLLELREGAKGSAAIQALEDYMGFARARRMRLMPTCAAWALPVTPGSDRPMIVNLTFGPFYEAGDGPKR